MSDYDIGHGTTAEISTDGGSTFEKLTGLVAVEFPNPTFDDIDVTTFDSPARAREYIAGLSDNGEVSLTILHVPGSTLDTMLRGALGSNVQLQLTENGGTAETHEVTVKGYERNIPMDDRMTAVLTLRIGADITGA